MPSARVSAAPTPALHDSAGNDSARVRELTQQALDRKYAGLKLKIGQADPAKDVALIAAARSFRGIAEGLPEPDNPIDGYEHIVYRIDRPQS